MPLTEAQKIHFVLYKIKQVLLCITIRISIITNTGFTCLLLSISKQQNKIVKLLLAELGIKAADSINISGITAAHVAASSGED